MFQPSKKRLLQQQHEAFQRQETLEGPPPLSVTDWPIIAANAQALMQDTPRAHIRPAPPNVDEAVPGFFDRDHDFESVISVVKRVKKSRIRRLIDFIYSATFLIIVRLIIFSFSAASLAHNRVFIQPASHFQSHRTYLIAWSPIALLYSLLYIPLLHWSPGPSQPFFYRSTSLGGVIVMIDSIALALQAVAASLAWQQFNSGDGTPQRYESRLQVAMQMVMTITWVAAHGATIMMANAKAREMQRLMKL